MRCSSSLTVRGDNKSVIFKINNAPAKVNAMATTSPMRCALISENSPKRRPLPVVLAPLTAVCANSGSPPRAGDNDPPSSRGRTGSASSWSRTGRAGTAPVRQHLDRPTGNDQYDFSKYGWEKWNEKSTGGNAFDGDLVGSVGDRVGFANGPAGRALGGKALFALG